MEQEIFEWLLLLGRWLHIVTAVTWIGTSIFFMWLDRTFQFNENSKNPGHVGDLWMVHGGGFYHVEKLLMGPTKVPDHLHWFKWESYWTWLSGFFLLVMIFYTSHGTFLLDSSVSNITYAQGLAIGLSSLVVSWFYYDFLWESKLTKHKPIIGHVLTLLWFAGMSYFLCQLLSGRAAYIHIGAMLGTWMTANVFLRIIPRQVKMVEAAKKGEPVNQDWGKNAKHRSTHNTYFTLPVIFIMLSNHFPFTYGNKYNWLVLLLMSAAGAAIREYFVVRISNPSRSKKFGLLGIAIILGVVFFAKENKSEEVSAEKIPDNIPAEVKSSAPVEQITGVDLRGTVKFEGKLPPKNKIPASVCASKKEIYSDEVIVSNGMLKNVVVRISKGLEGKSFTDVPPEMVVLDQKDCYYAPRVIAVRVGQKVQFVNSDPVFHNVKSVTKNNEEFNISMPTQHQRFVKTFQKPEIVVESKCSVHPWMSASIAVIEHPYFGVTNDKGEYLIRNLPAGSYTVEFWHEVFGKQTKDIVVSAKDLAPVDVTFKK